MSLAKEASAYADRVLSHAVTVLSKSMPVPDSLAAFRLALHHGQLARKLWNHAGLVLFRSWRARRHERKAAAAAALAYAAHPTLASSCFIKRPPAALSA